MHYREILPKTMPLEKENHDPSLSPNPSPKQNSKKKREEEDYIVWENRGPLFRNDPTFD